MPLISLAVANRVGAPSFAHFAKGEALAISRSSLYYRRQPRTSRADRSQGQEITLACGEKPAYGYRRVVWSGDGPAHYSAPSWGSVGARGGGAGSDFLLHDRLRSN
jgi:hypothetical protein